MYTLTANRLAKPKMPHPSTYEPASAPVYEDQSWFKEIPNWRERASRVLRRLVEKRKAS